MLVLHTSRVELVWPRELSIWPETLALNEELAKRRLMPPARPMAPYQAAAPHGDESSNVLAYGDTSLLQLVLALHSPSPLSALVKHKRPQLSPEALHPRPVLFCRRSWTIVQDPPRCFCPSFPSRSWTWRRNIGLDDASGWW